MAENDAVSSSKRAPPPRPTIELPPRASVEAWLGAGGFGASPGPLTLVSGFFSDSDPASDCRSFSQLLAGAMASPAAPSAPESGDGADLRFKQSRPAGLVVSQPQLFTIPPGMSPASLLESPGLFPGQGPFGMSHQQALAHVTAQAQSGMYMQGGLPTSLTTTQPVSMAPFSSVQQLSLPEPDTTLRTKEESHIPNSNERHQPSSVAVDKPADDGYNWRKYGQKQVKGCEFPRSYYKCTHPNCPVKKKVERSLDGQITEIIYKGQHNHPPPQSNKRGKDGGGFTVNLGMQSQAENASRNHDGLAFSLGRREQESSQATGECLSSSEEVGDEGATAHGGDEDERDAKRRNMEAGVSEQAASHRTVTEPRIIVQTTSEVDLLDDGYRWRKYGQKVVKGNPYPRSYYKCTYQGCNVRKHIERASTDPKAVITTYEGKHNHDIPAPRASSHNILQPPPRPQNHQPVALLQLKEERIS